jgi:3-deoxy-D-manno-octulosonate 8-phosphate phosphatase KdsC-like HAD superfamily phosphatase
MISRFISDVDGCLNDGVIYWSEQGKPFKAFGNYDHDGVITFITADKAGWNIMYSRIVEHMKCDLVLVPEASRYEFVETYGFDNVAYMGDGFYDAPIIQAARYGIAPAQGRVEARNAANYVTPSRGGEGAYFDACLWLLDQMGIDYAI